MADKCKVCGCICAQCSLRNDDKNLHHHAAEMHLHVEIEHLRQRLLERDSHIVTMETQFLNEADKFPNGELASMREEMVTWQEKYSRLYEAHKRVQKVNQNLEDKLLRIVDKCETEKSAFTKDIATLSHRLADANYTIHRLTQDNEKYRNDVNLAIQLLQCKPSNFVSQKYDSLPSDMQAKVRTYVAQKRVTNDTASSTPDVKSITVPISTFPPTAIVYNVTKTNNADKDSDDDDSDDSKPPVDIVSAAIMAKVLEERERERVFAKHCDTCTCHRSILTNDVETQTGGNVMNLECNMISNNSNNREEETNPPDKQVNDHEWTLNNFNKRATSLKYVNERSSTNVTPRKDCVSNSNSNVDKETNNSMRIGHYKTGYTLLSESAKTESVENLTNGSSPIKQTTFEKLTQRGPARNSKKIHSQSPSGYRISKSGNDQSKAKYKQVPCEVDLIDLKQNSAPPQRQIDVINDRIWKNEWSKTSLSSTMTSPSLTDLESRRKSEESQTIDVINDRIWKSVDNSTKSETNLMKPRIAFLELVPKPLANEQMSSTVGSVQNESQQSELDTASPSFSSDSLVISSSDPPSTSSDLVSRGNNRSIKLTNFNNANVINNNNNNNNNNSLVSNWQDRTAGPRGCSMRITPGSNNILLDNVGHYQTILYTSGGGGGGGGGGGVTGNGRPSTALVHTAKSTRSGGSASNSSDENISPLVLPPDNSQLQRVAEWIKASGPIERQRVMGLEKKFLDSENNKSNTDIAIKSVNCSAFIKVKKDAGKPPQIIKNSMNTNQEKKKMMINGKLQANRSRDSRVSTQQISREDQDLGDLISFESPVDEGVSDNDVITNFIQIPGTGNENSTGSDIQDVKVTREMEETYLKLAASLDPANLSLSPSKSADITIEKYRKEYKKNHPPKNQEKSGGFTS
ncbi:probable serine/threonine-protein kinase MARK-A [Athalia rosae]|uniref:probable serine/threonine-protein kinase MARK-A n=1 Tax=Athalia rosae TaxID=37344 RepID=UPI0020337F21|nr:probable serine/threonine-protein kinase MARK-A [Athalia rosae]